MLLGCSAVFLYILLLEYFGQGNRLEELFVGQLLLLQRLLEPQGRDDLDTFKLERISDGLGAALAPNQMRHVIPEPAANLTAMLQYCLFEKSIRAHAISENFKVERQAFEQL